MWDLPQPSPVRNVEHEWIPMGDGIRLSGRFWIPEGHDRAPVVLEYIPYRKRDLTRSTDDYWGKTLASHGIAFARIDVRGTGESEGIITDEYSEAELSDALDCIAWLSEQPWSNGNVGMRGISWGGINTLQVAARQPPALKAIMPICGTDNRFTDDAHFIGGSLARAHLQWGTLFKLVLACPPDPAIVGSKWESMWRERLETTPAIIADWLSHQRFDTYWKRSSVACDYHAIRVPTYLVGGWLDTYCDPIARLLENLSVPRKALIGPWGHIYPYFAEPIGLDWKVEEVRWWHHWLSGIDTGIMREPQVRVFMPYATAEESLPDSIPGRWIAETSWPPSSKEIHFHLGSGTLEREHCERAELFLDSSWVVGLCKPEWLNRLPLEQSPDDELSLVFDSSPLADDAEILGFPLLHLRVSSDSPTAQIAVRLTEVDEKGCSHLVTWGVRNLAHYGSHEVPAALSANDEVAVELPLHLIAHRFKKSSRIRIAISASLWPLVWPAPVPHRLALGAAHLVLPVRPAEALPSDFAIPENRRARKEAQPDAVSVERTSDGRVAMAQTSASSALLPELGLEITRSRAEHAEINEADPNTCRWTETASLGFKGHERDCRVEASVSLRSRPDAFLVDEMLRAWHGEIKVFERRHETTISRDLM